MAFLLLAAVPAVGHANAVRYAPPEISATFRDKAEAAARGFFIDGPRHTGEAIKANKKVFIAGAAATAVGSAISAFFGFDPTPVIVPLSFGIAGYQGYKSIPAVRKVTGLERIRKAFALIAFPAGLSIGTTAAGLIGAHAPVHAGDFNSAVHASGTSLVIAGDTFTIFAQATHGKDASEPVRKDRLLKAKSAVKGFFRLKGTPK